MLAVLLAVNARFTHSNLALRNIRNAMEEACPDGGLRVELREYQINQNRLDIVRDLAALKPDVILLSVYIWNAELLGAILPDLRSLLPDCRLIAGGPEAGYDADAWLKRHPELDLVVQGPGERAAAELVQRRFDTSAWPDRVLKTAPVPLSGLPFPYRPDDWGKLDHRYVYYETSRGCPFRCSYCLSSRDDQRPDLRDLGMVMDELDLLAGRGPALVKLVDRSFNAPPERARAIWERLIRKHGRGQTRWHFEVHPRFLGDDDFRLLADAPAGLFQFELGVQTVHDAGRALVDRPAGWARERDAIHELKRLGTVPLHLDILAGLPGEGLAQLGQSFDQAAALEPEHIQLGVLKGLPGTALRERAPSFGMVFQARPPYATLRTDALSSEDLALAARVAELVEGVGNSGLFAERLSRGYARHGGPWAFYLALDRHCASAGFDLRTRNREKLGFVLDAFLG